MLNHQQWLFFIFQIPTKPAYIRVKLWRSLKAAGAIPLKGSVYILPNTAKCQETFEWVRRQLMSDGGSAYIFSTTPLSGLTDSQIKGLFQEARLEDYKRWLKLAENNLKPSKKIISKSTINDLGQSLSQIQNIDFFGTAKSDETAKVLERIKQREIPAGPKNALGRLRARDFKSMTWVTRKGLHIDRLACAWFIQRFIDSGARFKFVEASRYRHNLSEIRFDMFDAEFTHFGDLCSFEVFVQRFMPKDLGLTELSKVIHDLDLNDNKYQRSETLGIAQIIKGIVKRYPKDEDRLRAASEVFENIFLGFNPKQEKN